MRVPLIIANWKMNHTVNETFKFVTPLQKHLSPQNEREIVICPPFTALYSLSVALAENPIFKMGAQNCHWENNGAYTGEISPVFLAEVSCSYVILGHSERRHIFGETDADIAKKIKSVLAHEMTPVFCVGETEKERKNNETFSRIESQLSKGLALVNKILWGPLVIAYEPVWAIGTGNNATPEQAEEVHAFIRHWLEKETDRETASSIRILYGGSVKPDNISSLMKKENIDGALVGGASLSVDSFLKIVTNQF